MVKVTKIWVLDTKNQTEFKRSSKISRKMQTKCRLDDKVKTFFFSQFTNEAVESPDHKRHHSFSVKCLWNVQIQILNLPKRPS